jgi:transcriptional regulator with PAS, ATPase and Fis domain
MSAKLEALQGESPRIVAIRAEVRHLLARQTGARRLPPILLLGETGTGKGLLAGAIHQAGPRRDGPFVAVNCAAIPETLLEAELFGYERGAFTDARQAKPGLFQTAHGGTLFLDEIGLLPAALQGKLLTVLEDRAVRRLGSTRAEPVDVALVAATAWISSRRSARGGSARISTIGWPSSASSCRRCARAVVATSFSSPTTSWPARAPTTASRPVP